MPVFAAGHTGGDIGVGHPVYGRRSSRKISRSSIFYLPDFLGPPRNFRIESRSPTTVHIVWTNISSVINFIEIERALGDGAFSFIKSVPSTQTDYTDLELEKKTRYRYRVRLV